MNIFRAKTKQLVALNSGEARKELKRRGRGPDGSKLKKSGKTATKWKETYDGWSIPVSNVKLRFRNGLHLFKVTKGQPSLVVVTDEGEYDHAFVTNIVKEDQTQMIGELTTASLDKLARMGIKKILKLTSKEASKFAQKADVIPPMNWP